MTIQGADLDSGAQQAAAGALRWGSLSPRRLLTAAGGRRPTWWWADCSCWCTQLLVIAGPYVTPYPYTEFHMTDTLKPPSWQFWFGTDQFGRDVFSRVVYGAHGTLLLSASATALGVGLGVAIGMTVGYRGGKLDEIVMRFMDGLLSFPSLLLAMLIMSSLGSSKLNVVIAIMIVFVPRSTRVLRSVALGLKNLEFVEAAKVRGESAFYVITRELLPNATGPIVVEFAIRLSFAILLSTSLGFIGSRRAAAGAGLGAHGQRRPAVSADGAVADAVPGARDLDRGDRRQPVR